MIPRILANTIQRFARKGFVTIIYGPRRVGKTVLLQQLTEGAPLSSVLFVNGDTEEGRSLLSDTSEVRLTRAVSTYDTVCVDEAQRILNVGVALKILIDKFPEKRFLITGSSSLNLARGLHEPLTGRNQTYRLFPLSTEEMTLGMPVHEKPSLLPEQLVYGGYPYLLDLPGREEKRAYLRSVVEDYLFKDVLALRDVDSVDNLRKLTSLLAFQVGSEVSLSELSRTLGIDVKTVSRYLSLLVDSFVVFPLRSFARNPRNEVAKARKYYFWDLGIRNGLIDQFTPLDFRGDVGQLWENFLAVERIKRDEYMADLKQYFFWRTFSQSEVDWVETRGEKVQAFEFKWTKKSLIRGSRAFQDAYKVPVQVISRDNYLDFVI